MDLYSLQNDYYHYSKNVSSRLDRANSLLQDQPEIPFGALPTEIAKDVGVAYGELKNLKVVINQLKALTSEQISEFISEEEDRFSKFDWNKLSSKSKVIYEDSFNKFKTLKSFIKDLDKISFHYENLLEWYTRLSKVEIVA